MTIRHLQIFSEVCRMESITKAAGNLNMAQPAVSNSIKELEIYYGVKLFERMNRRIYITNAGKWLLSYADSILTQFDEAKDVIRDIAATTRIRIGSNVSFGNNYLPDLLSRFLIFHPEIPVYTMIQNSSRIEDALLHNELDFAIVDTPTISADLYSRHLMTDTMTAVCSPDFPYLPGIIAASYPTGTKTVHTMSFPMEIKLSSLENIPLLLREPGSGSRNTVDHAFSMSGLTPLAAVESISTQALIEFCIKKMGILILPSASAKELTDSLQFIELVITDACFSRDYYLIYHKNKYFTKSMKNFIEQLFDPKTS